MIIFVLLFVGLPIAMSLVFGDKDRTIAYWMPMFLVIIFVLWTVISIPCALMQTKFHVPLYIFIGVLVLLVAFVIFMLIKRRRVVAHKVKDFFSNDAKKYFTNVFFIIMLVLVLYQAGRATIFTPQFYGDNKTYVALANDIVETDEFYVVDDATGTEITDISKVNTKFKLSGWYSFEAMLSVICGVTPLAMVYTYLPGVLIIMSYLVWWIVSKRFFDYDIKKMSLFVSFMVILYEFMNGDIADILLNWPTYGKHVTSMIIMPMLIFEWIVYVNDKENKKRDVFEMFLLVLAGCGASNMGFLMLPLEMVILMVTEFVCERKIQIRAIFTLIIINIPTLVFAILYLFEKRIVG